MNTLIRHHPILALSALVVLLELGHPLTASEATTNAVFAAEEHFPSVKLADGITHMTGVAISPLLGVSALGAWNWAPTPEALRDKLPWFCQPYSWGSGLLLLAFCFLKDFIGPAKPGFLKKPLDAAEVFEIKASALVACGAFIPFVPRYRRHAGAVADRLGLAGIEESGLRRGLRGAISWIRQAVSPTATTIVRPRLDLSSGAPSKPRIGFFHPQPST